MESKAASYSPGYFALEDEEQANKVDTAYTAYSGGPEPYAPYDSTGPGAAPVRPTSYHDLAVSSNNASDNSSDDEAPGADDPSTAVDAAPKAEDFHSEWKSLLAMPVSTGLQRVHKFLAIQRLFDKFAREATRIARIIVDELPLAPHAKSIRAIDAGGVAGGVKFISNSIFFKFTFDSEGLYSGDEFAAKAAGRELQGLEAYFSWILKQDNACDLFTGMQMLIDHAGYRLIASSLLPIDSKSLLYGSNDGGATVHADNMQLNALMQRAGEWLNLKPHVVNNTKLFGPADIEGHKGSDGLFYVLDTARVFPPDVPPRYFTALVVDASPNEPVRAVDVPSSGFQTTIEELLGKGAKTTPFFMGTIYESAQAASAAAGVPVNSRCSSLLMGSKEIRGKAVIIPSGWKGKFLYNLLRREFVQSYSVPLSSDAFSGFGRHNFKEHNEEVTNASRELKGTILAALADDFNASRIVCLNGAQLVHSMHSRGINVRLLGSLWALLTSVPVRKVAVMEMIVRAAKQLFRSVMRSCKTQDELLRNISHHMALLLSEDGQSTEAKE